MRYRLEDIEPTLPAEGCFIAPNATVIGRTEIGKDSSVWWNAVIRGDNELIKIGEGSNIQDFCMLHTDPGFPLTIGNGVTIGHHVVLHGCTIGDGALIGIGSTILNGAKIGKNCLVGAGALVTEGKEYEEGSLIVGSPAKAIRQLKDDALAMMKLNTLHYVENAKRYLSQLTALD